jgi:hypothetical protein
VGCYLMRVGEYEILLRLLTLALTFYTLQAYYLQARHLLAHPSRALLQVQLEQIPEEEQAWMRPLHELRPVSELQEQLESIIPFLPLDERMPAALELIHAWGQAQPGELRLPASIEAFYA